MARLATTVASDGVTNNRQQQHEYREEHARKVGFEGAFHAPISRRTTGVCALGKGNLSRRHVGSFRNFLFSHRRVPQVPLASVSQTHCPHLSNPVRAAKNATAADGSSGRVWAVNAWVTSASSAHRARQLHERRSRRRGCPLARRAGCPCRRRNSGLGGPARWGYPPSMGTPAADRTCPVDG